MQNQQNFGFVQPNNPRSQFLVQFANTERATETNTTILQALMLMNGKFIGDQTDLAKSELLAAIADMPGWDTKQRVSNLFLTAFSRNPTPEELEKFELRGPRRREGRQEAGPRRRVLGAAEQSRVPVQPLIE